jgi:putative membrane protein
MPIFARLAVFILGALHGYFGQLEMFRWTDPRTLDAFGMTLRFAEETKALAANQGLYNFFLAAGLVWAAVAPAWLARPLGLFFAGCALIAGLFGGVTGPDSIFLFQALPGALALATIYVSPRPKLR